jgi:hypothetical protein
MDTEFNIPAGTKVGLGQVTDSGLEAALTQAVEEKPKADERIKYENEERLNEFWNCVVKKAPFKREFEVRGLKVIFRTKKSKEIENLMVHMDKHSTTLVTTYDYLYAKALLAVSLVQLGEDYIDSGTFEQKRSYLDSLPEVIVRLLTKVASEFEKDVEAMEAEIYKPNF